MAACNGTAKIIDGKKISADIQNGIKDEINGWVAAGHKRPALRAILVGDDPASCTYVNKKMIASREVGIDSDTVRLPSTISQEDLVRKIEELNNDNNIDGILIQLPVPDHINEREICNAVHVDKDVDGFHVTNIGKLVANQDTFIPATSLAVIELIRIIGIDTFGKRAVVCGRSKNVGLPIFQMLHADYRNELPGLEATAIMCHRNTKPEDLVMYCQSADIIITATGVPGLIKPHMVKEGACIIDVGLTRITTPEGKSKLVGDADYEGCLARAGYITPAPGGVGPVTVAMLMKNTFKACKNFDRQRSNQK